MRAKSSKQRCPALCLYVNKSTEDLQLNELNKNGEMWVTGK